MRKQQSLKKTEIPISSSKTKLRSKSLKSLSGHLKILTNQPTTKQQLSSGLNRQFSHHVSSTSKVRLDTLQPISSLSPEMKKQLSGLNRQSSYNIPSTSKLRLNTLEPISSSDIKKRMENLRESHQRKSSQDAQQKISLSPVRRKTQINQKRLYQSKLNLSAQSWVIYDMKLDKYKSGWKPNKLCKFNGIFRIIVIIVYCRIIQENSSQIRNVKVMVQQSFLKQSKQVIPVKQRKRLKYLIQSKRSLKLLENGNSCYVQFIGTIIQLFDLVRGMLISGNQDLFEYAIIFCGYLLKHKLEKLEKQQNSRQSYLSIKEQEEEDYINFFCNYCNQSLFNGPESYFNLENTSCTNKKQSLEFISTSNQVGCIFLNSFRTIPGFIDMTRQIETLTIPIRFQVGYKYWQDRVIQIRKAVVGTFKDCYYSEDHLSKLVFKGIRNYEAICYNSQLDILMVIQDSKFSMADLDIKVLEDWFRTVGKQRQNNLNVENDDQGQSPWIKRSNTENSLCKEKKKLLLSPIKGMQKSPRKSSAHYQRQIKGFVDEKGQLNKKKKSFLFPLIELSNETQS